MTQDVTDYKAAWTAVYREAYAAGRAFWRPELATTPEFAAFLDTPNAPAPPARVLEAGCGEGLNALMLARRGYRVTGVDIVAEAVTRADAITRDEPVEIEFKCLDLARETLDRSAGYDLWVDIKTLHVFWDDRDRRAYLRQAYTCLKPGGVLYLQEALALRDVRDYYPEIFAALDRDTQQCVNRLDRDLPPEARSGIRCETLDWLVGECVDVGFEMVESRRMASLDKGWGAMLVASKPK